MLAHILTITLLQIVPTPNPLAAKILLIAGVVYGVVSTVKKFVPSITGKYALALNVGTAALGFVLTVPANQLFTIGTLLSLIAASAGAAGIHGTVSKLTEPAAVEPAGVNQPNQAKPKQG